MIQKDTVQMPGEFNSGDQTSANAYAAHAGSVVDAFLCKMVAMTIKVATNGVTWTVYGANLSDFSDKVEVQAEAAVAAAGVGSYATTAAPWRYYRAEIKSTVGGAHGVVTAQVLAK